MAYGIVVADVMQTSIPNGVLGAKNASTLQNRLIDAGFIINQRNYVSNTALSAGTYAHDRWKAGASGCTYTFTQGSAGVPIVITITAGSLQQVIEGCNMPEGGTYVLSWTGTAQARFNGGTYGSSPLAVTGITAGANTTIEFNTGTLSYPQLEVGSSATGFEYRQYGTELALCYRYYWRMYSAGNRDLNGYAYSTNAALFQLNFPVTMRSSSVSLDTTGTASQYEIAYQSNKATANAVPSINANNQFLASIYISTSGTPLTAGNGVSGGGNTTSAWFGFSSEL